MAPALLANIRLRLTFLTLTNTLSYYIIVHMIYEGSLETLLANTILVCKWMSVTNALSYCFNELVTIVKGFVVQATEMSITLLG